MSSRQFNQDAAGAKRAAREGPVFITDRGKPAHVLLTVEQYHKLSNPQRSLVDMLSGPPELADAEFDPPRMGEAGFGYRIPDFEE